jgi:hypothetical protein
LCRRQFPLHRDRVIIECFEAARFVIRFGFEMQMDDFEVLRLCVWLRMRKFPRSFVWCAKGGGDSDSGVSYRLSMENMYGVAAGDGVPDGVGVQGVILIPAFQFASSYSSSWDFHRGGESLSSLLNKRSAWNCIASVAKWGLSSAMNEVVRMRFRLWCVGGSILHARSGWVLRRWR